MALLEKVQHLKPMDDMGYADLLCTQLFTLAKQMTGGKDPRVLGDFIFTKIQNIYFHGTTLQSLENILMHGLKPPFYGSGKAQRAVEYASIAPEWFATLIGEENYGDKERARFHFEQHASPEQMPHFEQYWTDFANKQEAAVVIFRPPFTRTLKLPTELDPVMAIKAYLLAREVDRSFSYTIDPSKLDCVKFKL